MTPDRAFHSFEPPEDEPIKPSDAEVVDSEDFRSKLDQDWQSTREAYQDRISSIMDDFLTKGLEREKPEPEPAPKQAPRRPGVSRENLEAAVIKMAHQMRDYEDRMRAANAAPLALPAPAAPSRKKWIIGAVAGAIALSVMVGIHLYGQVGAYTPLPYARTGAIMIADGKIYIADWLKKSVYVHAAKRGAPILSVESLSSSLLTGLATDGKNLWSVDGLSSQILRHAMTPDHLVIEKFEAPGERPAGLVVDRDAMWTSAKGKLYRLRTDDPTEVVEMYAMPNVSVTALQLRGRRVWALDGKAREIEVFRLQKDLKQLASLDLDPFLRGGMPTGLAIEGSDAWVVTENPSAIVRVPLRKLKKSDPTSF